MAGKHGHDKIAVQTNVMNVLTDLVWVKSGGVGTSLLPLPRERYRFTYFLNGLDYHCVVQRWSLICLTIR